MNRLLRRLVAGSAASAALLAGCGTSTGGGTPAGSGTATTASSAPATTTSRAITTPDLVAALLSPEDMKQVMKFQKDFPTQWSIVQNNIQMVRIQLCGKASEETAHLRDTLYWPAHIKLVVDGMPIMVQESLVTGQPAEMKMVFGALREGLRVCLGVPGKGLSDDSLTSERYDDIATPVADHYATRYVITKGTQDRIDFLFRDGAVLGHIVLWGVPPDANSARMMQEIVNRSIEKLTPTR